MDEHPIDFTSRVRQLADLARSRQAIIDGEAEPHALPVWLETIRSAPNAMLRSALFGINRRRQPWHDGSAPVPSPSNVTIVCHPQPLDQYDLDVWIEIIHKLRKAPAGELVPVSMRSILSVLHRQYGQPQRRSVSASIQRLSLQHVRIEFKNGERIYDGRMLESVVDARGDSPRIAIHPRMPELWEAGWGGNDPDIRRNLGRNQMAKWLYGFYVTHPEPLPYKVATLRYLCGSVDGQLFKFRYNLKRALTLLEENAGWLWKIDEHDRVHLLRPELVDKSPKAGDES